MTVCRKRLQKTAYIHPGVEGQHRTIVEDGAVLLEGLSEGGNQSYIEKLKIILLEHNITTD